MPVSKPLVELHPYLREVWNVESNKALGLELESVTYKNRNEQIWIDCKDCNRTHMKTLASAIRYNRCKYKNSKFLKDNKRLMKEWVYEKNTHLNDKIDTLLLRSSHRAWWKCQDCNSEWDARLDVRITSNCPYCAKIRFNETNSFFALSPHRHLTALDSIELSKTISQSNGEVEIKIQCDTCEHIEPYIPKKLKLSKCCPECGYNYLDKTKRIKTEEEKREKTFREIHPELVDSLVDASVAEEKPHYNKCYEWYCNCGSVTSYKINDYEEKKDNGCKNCKVKGSYPERFMYGFLMENNIKFNQEKVFDWLPNKRYDFYIPSTDTIIEVHGGQHYEDCPTYYYSYESVHENDVLKEQTALANGITNYVVINASKSSFSFLKKSLLNSPLLNILNIQKDDIDWIEVGKTSLMPPNLLAVQYWNSGIHSVKRLQELVHVCDDTIRNYLLKGVELGICDYSKEKAWKQLGKDNKNSKKVACYDAITNEFVKEFFSLGDAGKWFAERDGITSKSASKSIKKVLDKERKDGQGCLTYKNFIWKTVK